MPIFFFFCVLRHSRDITDGIAERVIYYLQSLLQSLTRAEMLLWNIGNGIPHGERSATIGQWEKPFFFTTHERSLASPAVVQVYQRETGRAIIFLWRNYRQSLPCAELARVWTRSLSLFLSSRCFFLFTLYRSSPSFSLSVPLSFPSVVIAQGTDQSSTFWFCYRLRERVLDPRNFHVINPLRVVPHSHLRPSRRTSRSRTFPRRSA